MKGTWAVAAIVMWWLGGGMAFLPLVIDTTRVFRAWEIVLDIFLLTGLISFVLRTRLAIIQFQRGYEALT